MCTKLLSKMCISTTDLVFVKFLVLEMIYYHVHNILRLFDGWTDFPFTTCVLVRNTVYTSCLTSCGTTEDLGP